MKSSTVKTIRLIADIIISVMLFVSGLLLCFACLSIYGSADTQMFTYEKIGVAWNRICPVIYITVGMIALRAIDACIESYRYPNEKLKLSPFRSKKALVKRMSKHADIGSLSQEKKAFLAKERKLRKVLLTVNIILCTACSLFPLIYIADPDRYIGTTSAECTEEVLHCIVFYIICLIPAAIFNIVYATLTESSFAREADVIKKADKLDTESGEAVSGNVSSKGKPDILVTCLRLGIIAVAAVFIVIGSINGGMQDVLKKAAEICAECIGLG